MKPDTDYEKRDLLIQAAKAEFLEKGYNKASLRSICAKAGMTTGALYFFFENKEDLYYEITGSAKQKLIKLIQNHIAKDKDAMQHITDVNELFFDHSVETDMFIDCIYNDYDSFMLIFSGSKEGELEKCVDEFVKLTEESSTDLMNAVPSMEPDPFMSHWIAHTIVDSFVHVVTHEPDLEKAKVKMRFILNFIVQGWTSLLVTGTNSQTNDSKNKTEKTKTGKKQK
jgi:AcrR family transcriptional regulator